MSSTNWRVETWDEHRQRWTVLAAGMTQREAERLARGMHGVEARAVPAP